LRRQRRIEPTRSSGGWRRRPSRREKADRVYWLEFARIFDQVGFPKGVLNVITGFGAECGAVLTSHPKVDHIAFTGGPDTARYILRNSAENLSSTSLELGGKSPFIVFEDADIESAVNAQVSGIFAATGQSCVAVSRLVVSNKKSKTPASRGSKKRPKRL